MKRLVLVLLLSSAASFAIAQKADSAVSKSVKAKNVDGAIMMSNADVVTNLSVSPQFTTLVKLISAAGIADSLKTGTITFLAPTNKAFDKLPAGTIDSLLLPNHKADLVNLLNQHIVSGKLTSKDINRQIKADNGQATLTTISGRMLTARINENRNIVLTDENGDQAIIARLDIDQSNGVLFVISGVLLPKPKQ
jgi:uncharacterized surface protein with fasciclin (FAS1) repeats